MKLKLDYCSHEAASYAVENWHYSHNMPNGKLVKIGVWEDDKFIGAILFGRGANNNLLTPYGLKVTEGCELVRIALRDHQTPVTKLVSIALKLLKKSNPGLKLIVSFADERQGHVGGIYKAGNWIYTGKLHSTPEYFYHGKYTHQRSINLAMADGRLSRVAMKALRTRDGGYRYRYLMPLNEEMKEKILPLRKEPPKKSVGSLMKNVILPDDSAGSQPSSTLKVLTEGVTI